MDDHRVSAFFMNGVLKLTLALAFIFAGTHFLEQSGIDFWVQGFLYTNKVWLIDGTDQTLKFFIYEGPKKLLMILCGALLITTLIHRLLRGKQAWHGRVFFFLTCMISVPMVISLLKEVTCIYCPGQLIDFGGTHTLRPLFDFSQLPTFEGRGKCYPAGHATAGFALMSLYYVFNRPMLRWCGLIFGVILGSILAFYQMAKGAHFLSHSLATFGLSWVIIVGVHRISAFFNKK